DSWKREESPCTIPKKATADSSQLTARKNAGIPARGCSREAGNEGRVRTPRPRANVEPRKSKLENRKDIPLPPSFFVSAHSKGVTALICVTAHSKEVTRGQFRPKPGKTRCLLVTAHSKGVTRWWRVTSGEMGEDCCERLKGIGPRG